MCGIVGIVSKNEFPAQELLSSLKHLEYRGYDSFGFATNSGLVFKDIGEIKAASGEKCTTAISHTRWATTGAVTKENAHPHADCSNSLFIVHNGIIENYEEIKMKLGNHAFRSETDSEVVAHYLEENLKAKTMEQAIMDFFKEAKGTFAVLILQKNSDKIYAMKKDSPLVLGVSRGENFIASDIYAFSGKTDRAVFFDDNEFAVVTPYAYTFYSAAGKEIVKKVETIKTGKQESKEKFGHFMLKEIMEQPAAAKNLLDSLKTSQKHNLEKMKAELSGKKAVFVASGTSYHAALLGVYFFHKAGLQAQAIIASEFRDYASINEDSVVMAISQSGETMDVIDAIKFAKEKRARIMSMVNTPMSTVERLSDLSLHIEAGQEICVAATKSFTNQVIELLQLAGHDCENIPEKISAVFGEEGKIKSLAKTLAKENDIYIIGRGLSYPVAREIALKLKEISYIHAEGMMGGELKHGTLALVEKGTPVIGMMNGNPEIISNIEEAEARGADIIAITNKKTKYEKEICIPAENDIEFALLSNIVGQLLTYYVARGKSLPIDKPRNLAKSVTVK